MDLSILNWQGLAIGACTFLIIGIFHPLVIKGEYYLGLKVNYIFALLGVVASIAALMTEGVFLSAVFAVIAFSSFWSIWEVFEQKERVRKGWFPANPKRTGNSKNRVSDTAVCQVSDITCRGLYYQDD